MPSKLVIVGSLAAISFVIGGSGAVAIGLFIGPMMTEFGWPNALASSAATAFILAGLFAAPVVGIAIDKFGAQLVMALGVLANSAGYLLVSQCHNRYEMFAGFLSVGVGNCASFAVPTAVVVTNWMHSRKGLGMGIIWGALSVGAAMFSLLISWWIEARGWRLASEALSILAATMLPLTLFAVRTRPQGPQHTRAFVESTGAEISDARRQMLLSWPFIFSTASSALFAIGMTSIYYHVVPVLIKAGYPIHVAGIVFGASWVLSALGSLVFGAVAGRSGAKKALVGTMLLCGAGTLFLLGAGQSVIGKVCLVAFVILWGMPANSANQFIPVILAERFGFGKLGTLIGVQSSVMGIAGAGVPIVTGALYDRFNDYHLAIYLSASATLIAFSVALMIDAPKPMRGAT